MSSILLLILLTLSVMNCSCFVQQLLNNAHKHDIPQTKSNLPAIPDSDTYSESHEIDAFHPGGLSSHARSEIDHNIHQVAPFSTGSNAIHRRRKRQVFVNERGPRNARCLFLDNIIGGNMTISGTVALNQNDAESPVKILGTIHGLSSGLHGFHLTQFGDVSDHCFGVGKHFNPFNKTHGAPDDTNRHVGDLGNIFSDATNTAHVDIEDKQVTLFGRYSVIGRAFVIHAVEDDLGRSLSPLSKLTGNPGPHIACCTIGWAVDDVLSEMPERTTKTTTKKGGHGGVAPDSFGFAR